MEYEDKIANLNKEKRRLERCSFRSSATENFKYLQDYIALKDVFDLLGEKFKFEYRISNNTEKNFDRKKKNNKYDDVVFNKEFMHNGIDMYEVFTRYRNLFEDAGFYDYNNPGYLCLSNNERLEIVYSYLDYLLPNGSNLFKELRDNFSCLIGDDLNLPGLGASYPIFNKPDESTIFISEHLRGKDIFYMLVLIHEIIHYYSTKILYDYGNSNSIAYMYGKLCEVLSVYTEFSFLEWLKKNKIHTKSVAFANNYNLSLYYVFIERFRCYYYCLKNNEEIRIEGNDKIIFPEKELNFDTKLSDKRLKLNNGLRTSVFNNVVAFLKTFDLLEMEASGENMDRVFKDFLASVTDKKQETSILLNEKNDDAIRKFIKDNEEECKRLYRYK